MLKLPERPSLEQLRKQAKDLLRSAHAGDENALRRLFSSAPVAKHRLLRERVSLNDAQLAVAREYGFDSWPQLVRHVESVAGAGTWSLRPLIRPVELTSGRTWRLPDGTDAKTDEVFATFVAARDGDLPAMRQLVGRFPALATVEYNYTPPIHFAVREGHRDITAFLIERGADVGAYRSYPFGEALLTYAEHHGHVDVAELLKATLSRKYRIAAGTQAILGAAKDGDLWRVRQELERDPALARVGNETGDTALHQAAKHGHLSVVQALVDADAEVDAERGDGYRPVHCALMPNWFSPVSSRTRDAIAELLLSKGARYTVFIAALRGDMEFVRNALARDRSLASSQDSCHHRVLSAAVRRQDVAMTRLLLEHGADPNLPEEGAPRGASLLIAVQKRNRELVRMLLAAGADPNAEVDSSGTPMLSAAGDEELLAMLRAHGGRVDRNPYQEPVVQLLKQGKYAEAEAYLRKHPEVLDVDDAGYGDGILAGPAHAGNHELIDMLLRLGARVPPVTKWGPEYYFKHYDTAKFLLQRGMDPNHMNWHRFTLLHHFAAIGDVAKVKLLLDHGADIDAVDEEYRLTPAGIAARRGHSSVVQVLLERGASTQPGT